MEELKWPVTKCTGCNFDLREVKPKANDKAKDAGGRLTWVDYCPKCGRGYTVGYRVLPRPPAEALAEMEAKPILSYVEDKTVVKTEGEASGVPPDERGKALAEETDPESLLSQELEAQPEKELEPGAIKPPGKGQFFCTKCASNHSETSGIGKRHLKHRE